MTQTETPRATSTETTEKPTRRTRVEMSVIKLSAGALAAMTAAVIGSRLGVSGTVIGAAVGSIVAGLTGSLYTASLERGHKVIVKVPLVTRTLVMERPTAERASAAAIPPGVPTLVSRPVAAVREKVTRRRRAWKPVLATAAAIFALAGVGITAIELATGHSLSGREGTTISQVGEPLAQQQEPLEEAPVVEEPTEEASQQPTETPSETPTQTPTEAPTEEATETPSEQPTETPSEAPTETPSQEPTEAPSEDPTAVTEAPSAP